LEFASQQSFKFVCIGLVLAYPVLSHKYSFIKQGADDGGKIFGKDRAKDDRSTVYNFSYIVDVIRKADRVLALALEANLLSLCQRAINNKNYI